MKTTRRQLLIAAALAIALAAVGCATQEDGQPARAPATVQTRIGELNYEVGFPTKETVARLYDEMDFQRAVMAYQYAETLVALNEMNVAFKAVGINEGDMWIVERFLDPHGVALTGNNVTIYAVCFLDLAKNGPMVVEVPASAYGALHDLWQQPLHEFVPTGDGQGKSQKFVVVPNSFKDTLPEGYTPIRTRTTLAVYLARGIVKNNDVAAAAKSLEAAQIYPLSKRDNPPKTRVVPFSGKDWYSISPQGFDYWKRVADVVNRIEADEDRDFLVSLLKPLGIEPGKPFNPDERQKKILTDASVFGWSLSQALAMAPRSKDAIFYPGTQWEDPVLLDPSLKTEFWRELEVRTEYYWQATMATTPMKAKTVGAGSRYLRSARDRSGEWLDGGKNYRLHVPANPPAKNFWSVTVHDYETRSQIATDQNIAARSSNDKLIVNGDGSVDVYFGPQAPAGKESNWIKTIPGRGWFAWFRTYGPMEAYFDKSWRLADFELVK